MDDSEYTADRSPPSRHVIGMMTGTSIDGIDAALLRIEGYGPTTRAELVSHITRSIGKELSRELRRAANQEKFSAGEFARMAMEFGERHADVAAELVDTFDGLTGCDKTHATALTPGPSPKGRRGLDIVAVHGQTVFHAPPASWQMINVSPIAERLRVPVVFDLRAADLAAGGQGAPITPMADWVLFRSKDEDVSRAIVNLGGFCNVTILGRHEGTEARRHEEDAKRAVPFPARSTSDFHNVKGYDVCACNQLLDAVAREALGAPFDKDGEAASAGHIHAPAAESLRDILLTQSKSGRSLGTGDEAARWVQIHINDLSPNDLAASAVWAVANCIAETIAAHQLDEIYLAGGGAKHRLLTQLLKQHCNAPVDTIKSLGMPIESREAAAMAVLGALCADGVPITLPHVTGCASPAPVAGVWAQPGRRFTTELAEGTEEGRELFV